MKTKAGREHDRDTRGADAAGLPDLMPAIRLAELLALATERFSRLPVAL